MPAFSYTSGNITNLAAGVNASMGDIQGSFVDLRTFLNGGTMDETNVPNLSAAFTTYKIHRAGGAHAGGLTANTYIIWAGGTVANAGPATPGTATTAQMVFWLDPTDFAANSRTTKMRLRALAIPNAVAPAVNFTVGLYPAATFGGASGTAASVATLGTVISGSTAALTAPPASTATRVDGLDFNMPAAGPYVLGMVVSGTQAAGSLVAVNVELQYRQT